MSNNPNSLEILKDLLFREERAKQADTEKDVNRLEDEIKVREKMEQNIEPILADWFMRFRREFPKEFGHLFYQTLEKEINENPERIQNALYPLFVQMFEQYTGDKRKGFWDNLGFGRINKLKDPTTLYREKVDLPEEGKAKAPKGKVSLSDLFVLENTARNLLGMRSKFSGDSNQEVTSLMLDTVRRMVEDAVVRNKTQALDWVDFNGYKIYLITFKRISVACTVNGQPNEDYMTELEDRVMDFAKEFLPDMDQGNFDYNTGLCSRLLSQHFPEIGH